MAARIFLAIGSLLIKEMRRRRIWHWGQSTSMPNTRRRRSDHLMYLDLRLGSSWPASAAGAIGTTSFREAACDESTPQYRTVCLRGGAMSAARRAMSCSYLKHTASTCFRSVFPAMAFSIPS
jgi:hypothetical protein